MGNTIQESSYLPLFDSIPLGIILVDHNDRILHINRFATEHLCVTSEERTPLFLADAFSFLSIDQSGGIQDNFHFVIGEETFLAQRLPLYDNEDIEGSILIFQHTSTLEKTVKELDLYKNLSLDLKAIFDISYDVIYVSDGDGITLRVSSACETLWGYREEDLIGKSTYELEKEGVFCPSITRLVLEKQEQVSMIQTTKTGRRLKVVGTPIKDKDGHIIRVVNASRDITEISQLQSEIQMLKQLTEGYRKEIMDLRAQKEFEKEMIYRSEKMEKVVSFSQKVAKVDSTVLLQGESGTGKEVIASYIHKWSRRSKGPFIAVHCGAIPQTLLEAELFGYDDGAEVKVGAIEMANEGTLLLEEIEEIPLALQVKLLRAIQERRMTRVGSKKLIEVSPRIIAATIHDLEERVQSGTFRKELYYQLNVIPICIPPLRERKEDIIPLILHFVQKLNQKYEMRKRFKPELLKALQEYEWPGNVRELQNLTERLLVTAEGDWIDAEYVPNYIYKNSNNKKVVQIHNIIPLKDAIELLEKELLELAQKQYGSTTRIAVALGVNQSTISRKLNKLKEK